MVNVNKYLFVLFVLTATGVSSIFAQKLLLTVYYESKCPDSRSFVLRQLRPAMRLLQEHVRIQFVPFGKARSFDNGFEGFVCQHGPEECYGNMVQDCTLELMRSLPDRDKLDYVACELDTYAAINGSYECIERANVQPELVRYCVDGDKGTMLQLYSEYLTNRIQPKFIPAITINKKFSQAIHDSSRRDLLGTLCATLLDAPFCASHFNRLAWHAIMDHRNKIVKFNLIKEKETVRFFGDMKNKQST